MPSLRKLPKLFQQSPSKQLRKFVQSSAKQANGSNDEFEQVLINVLDELWKDSEQSQDALESRVKTVISRLEDGLTRAEYIPRTVLTGLVTIHRLLLEGPDHIYAFSCFRTCLQLLFQVSERASGTLNSSVPDDYASNGELKTGRVHVMASQYASLLKEKIEILKDYGSIIGGDWCPPEEMGKQNLYIFDFLEARIAPSDSLRAVDSESPDVVRRDPDYRIPTAIKFFKRVALYGQSLSMLTSRLTGLLNSKTLPLDLKQHIFNVTFLETRCLFRLLMTMIVSVVLQQVVPQCDENRYHEFVKKHPCPQDCCDDQKLWKQLRNESEESRYRLIRKLTNVLDTELCTCQYQMLGGEAWLLRSLILIMRSDILPFYFPEPETTLTSTTQIYLRLLRLKACSAPDSLKQLTEIRNVIEQVSSALETVIGTLKAASATENMSLGFKLTDSAATLSRWSCAGIARIGSLARDVQGLETGSDDENKNPFLTTNSTRATMINNPSRGSSSTRVPSSSSTASVFIPCEFESISSCGHIPIFGIDTTSAQRKWWKRWSTSHRQIKIKTHRIIDPVLLPDKRLLSGVMTELQLYLTSVSNAQLKMVHHQQRLLNDKKRQLIATPAPSSASEVLSQRRNTPPSIPHQRQNTPPLLSHRQHTPSPSSPPTVSSFVQVSDRGPSQSKSIAERSSRRQRGEETARRRSLRGHSRSRSPVTPYTAQISPNVVATPHVPQRPTQPAAQHFRVLSDSSRPRSMTPGPRAGDDPTRRLAPHNQPQGMAISPLAAMAGYPTTLFPPGSSPTRQVDGSAKRPSERVPLRQEAIPVRRAQTPPRRAMTPVQRPSTPPGRGAAVVPMPVRVRNPVQQAQNVVAPRYTPRDTPVPTGAVIHRHSQPLVPLQNLPSPSPSQSSPAGSATLLAAYEIRSEEVHILQRIGSGATATVYKGSWQGTEVAVKMFNEKSIKESRSEVIQELLILFKVRHPNLVLIMGTVLTRTPSPGGGSVLWPKAFVSEYCEGGTLFSLLHRKQGPKLSWSQRIKIARDVAQGCCYLHTFHPPIVHRDLKSLNILLTHPVSTPDDNPHAKISDFGMSSWKNVTSSTGSGLLHGIAGTYHWMAPEVVLGRTYRESVDIYSYGIILYELCSDALPYEELNYLEPQVIGRLVAVEGRRPSMSKLRPDCPKELRELMASCWSHEPSNRPSFQHIIQVLNVLRR